MLCLFLRIACVVLLTPDPEPAYFVVKVEARQPVTVKIDGQVIVPGKMYKTQPIRKCKATITAKFVRGDDIVEEEFEVELVGGMAHTFTLTINAMPTERWTGTRRSANGLS